MLELPRLLLNKLPAPDDMTLNGNIYYKTNFKRVAGKQRGKTLLAKLAKHYDWQNTPLLNTTSYL
jgi:hypothetical protein